MLHKIKHLSEEEKQVLYDAIPNITLLIGEADGKLNPKEEKHAEKITRIRSFTYTDQLKSYYIKVGENFLSRLHELSESYPLGKKERRQAISNKLERLNPILRKIDEDVADALYGSYKTFAMHVARSTGGFLTFASISPEEDKYLDLPMINPIYK